MSSAAPEASDDMRQNTRPFRLPRLTATIALSALCLGITGCGFFVEQGTTRFPADTDIYRSSAGDGVNPVGTGPLTVRNVLVVATEEGTEGNLIAAIVNDTDEDHRLHIVVGEASGTALNIPVPAETTVSFGQYPWLEDPPLIEGLGAIPGSMVRMYFQSGDAEGVVAEVPVLGGCLEYLRGLEPGDSGIYDECPWHIDEVP